MSDRDNRPVWTGKAGRYEVWHLTMSDGAVGYWIRYSLLSPTAGPSQGRLWFARFRRQKAPAVVALNAPGPFEVVADPLEIRIGAGAFSSGRATGAIVAGGHDVVWDLEFPADEETYRLLPGPLYRGRLAPTRPYSPNPAARFSGRIVVDGEEHSLDGMPGQQGHLFGTRHAERWAWFHCGSFDGEDAVAQGLVAQGKRGPLTTPFATFLGLRWQGAWLRFSKVSRQRDYSLGVWRIDLSSRTHRLTGRVAGDPAYLVRARYEDPDGSARFCHNTEVASSRFVLFERTGRRAAFEEVAVLSSEGTTQAEWAGRTPAPVDMAEHLDAEGLRE